MVTKLICICPVMSVFQSTLVPKFVMTSPRIFLIYNFDRVLFSKLGFVTSKICF